MEGYVDVQKDELTSICRHTLLQVDDFDTNGHIHVVDLEAIDRCLLSRSYNVDDTF